MPKRGENIRKRKDGRWEARYRKGTAPDGTPLYGSVYAKTYREVKAKQLAIRTAQTPPQSASCRFGQVLELWLEANRVHLKGATLSRYRYLIDSHITPALGGMDLNRLTAPVINAFLADKMTGGRLDGSGGLSASYVRSIMLVVCSAQRFAAEQGMCAPMATKVNKPPPAAKEIPVLSPEDQKKLYLYCIGDPDETRLGILISLYTGLRIGEVCALRWEDVDLSRQTICVRHTVSRVGADCGSKLIIDRPKTPSSLRVIPICTQLLPVLQSFHTVAGSGFVLTGCEDFVSPRTYEYRFHKVLRESGVVDLNYHALRHTFATRCIEAGVDVKSLSEILGHADASITLNTYVHSSMEQKRRQLEKLTVL